MLKIFLKNSLPFFQAKRINKKLSYSANKAINLNYSLIFLVDHIALNIRHYVTRADLNIWCLGGESFAGDVAILESQ